MGLFRFGMLPSTPTQIVSHVFNIHGHWAFLVFRVQVWQSWDRSLCGVVEHVGMFSSYVQNRLGPPSPHSYLMFPLMHSNCIDSLLTLIYSTDPLVREEHIKWQSTFDASLSCMILIPNICKCHVYRHQSGLLAQYPPSVQRTRTTCSLYSLNLAAESRWNMSSLANFIC